MTRTMTNDEKVECAIMNVGLRQLEREMDLPLGFLVSLREVETDWDFIAKVALVLEAVLTRAIHKEVQDTTTYDKVSKMKQWERIEKAVKLNLISQPEEELLRRFSKIRNDFMHGIANLNRPLLKYLSDKPPIEQEKAVNAFLSAGVPGKLKAFSDPQQRQQFAHNFRQVTLRAVFPMVLDLGHSHDNKKREREHLSWRASQEKLLGRPLPPRKPWNFDDRMMVQELVDEKRAAESNK